MEIIQYTESLHKAVYLFIKKVFKENGRDFCPKTKEKDMSNISQEYLSDGNFWCLTNGNGTICGTIALRKIEDYYEIRRFFILTPLYNYYK